MTTKDLMTLGDALGDLSAVLTFVGQRANTRYRETLAELNRQAELAVQEKPAGVQQLPAEGAPHQLDDLAPIAGFTWPPPEKKSPPPAR